MKSTAFIGNREREIVTCSIFAGSFMGPGPKHETDENGKVTTLGTGELETPNLMNIILLRKFSFSLWLLHFTVH